MHIIFDVYYTFLFCYIITPGISMKDQHCIREYSSPKELFLSMYIYYIFRNIFWGFIADFHQPTEVKMV